ncbi:MAG TPA: endonuclease MutS2, partial [Chloroflexota bacterium]|nr:endonuclease MutS2 [Chloroflexota bacterium]
MNQKALDLLEYARVREQLAGLCGFTISKDLARTLEPSADGVLVTRRLGLTTEATRILNTSPNVTTGGARDIRPALDRARRGGVLDAEELLAIQATIGSSRVVRTLVLRMATAAPGLADFASLMVDCPSVEAEIGRCLSDTGDVLDSASPELARIRAEIKVAHQRLLDRLHDIVFGGAYKSALQDQLITIREGRYVVPVRSDSRGQLKGLIHDQSSSGQTVYVEPLATVELNNRWRGLQLDERREIERILRELSGLVAGHADGLEATVVNLGEIDLHLAKARLAEAQRAIEPTIEITRPNQRAPGGERGMRLVKARHPLLTGKVVPIDFRLGDDFQVMVITGPNTGGKTVALKTAGLLTLMAQAGMHIPAEAGSRIHVFSDVLADIGDEQSIEQNLSTFSSHMRNVVNVVRQA